MSAHAAYLRDWRRFRTFTDGRCEAACTDWHDRRRGKQCAFSGAFGTSGRVLCRRHQDAYDRATGGFWFADLAGVSA